MGESRKDSGMDDGRSPSGGADTKDHGGKGGYALDSRRSEAETTVGYITNNGIKNDKKTIIKDKFYSFLITFDYFYYRI